MNARELKTDNRPLPIDNNLSYEHFLDENFVLARLSQYATLADVRLVSCRVKHIRYQPDQYCFVLYHIEYAAGEQHDPIPAVIYAKCLSKKRYEIIKKKTREQKSNAGKLLGGPIILDEFNTILYDRANDPEIPLLSILENKKESVPLINRLLFEKVASPDERLTDFQLISIRYKPENRFVGKIVTVWSNLKSEAKRELPFIIKISGRFPGNIDSDNRQSATDAEYGLPVFAQDPEMGLHIFNIIAGEKLSEILRGDDSESGIALAAEALARLHSTPADHLPVKSVESIKERISRIKNNLRQADSFTESDSTYLHDLLMARLKELTFDQNCFVHGDYHPGQLLCEDGKCAVIDFDRAARFDRHYDLGNFLAQLKLLSLRDRIRDEKRHAQLFCESYLTAGGANINPESIKFFQALALYELSVREFRRLKPNWPTMIQNLLCSGRNLLDA